jgi:catechol 2,3-dioxygenase-like lactoylglutathione lyase family enzyme
MGVPRVVPDLTSTSLEAAKGFYGDVPGLQPVMDHGWIATLADPERPGAQISLMTHDATAPVIPTSRFTWMTWTPATRQRPTLTGARQFCARSTGSTGRSASSPAATRG